MTVPDGTEYRRRNANGFSLVEVLVGMLVLSIIAIAVAAITSSLMMQFSNGSDERLAEGTTAQWASVSFVRDVQGASGLTTECAPGIGNRLITFKSASGGAGVEYRIKASGATGAEYSVYRTGCGAGHPSTQIVSGLGFRPSVACDDAPCVDDSHPRVVTLHVSRSTKFDFTLKGVRRTTDGNVDPAAIPKVAPPFISLGGANPLSISGAAKLTVFGDAFINNPGTTAAKLTQSGSLTINGNLIIQKGSTSGPVLVATGNPILHVSGNGPSASEMSVCGWCDIGITGSGPGTTTAAFADPFRFIPAPDASSLPTKNTCELQANVYLCRPGIYPGSFPPVSPGDAKFRLEPGNYVLRGGFALHNGRSVESNGGVMFYLQSGGVSVDGDTKLTLSPQTSGVYSGLLFFQPASNTSAFNISNGGQVTALKGTIYVPAASSVNLSSGAGTLRIGQVVGQNVSITNSGAVIIGAT